MATPAFDLDQPVRHVILTVGPVRDGGDQGEAEVLALCYRRSLAVADELDARGIALPAIAAGVYGYPTDQAAQIAITTIRSTPTTVTHVRLVAFDHDTYQHPLILTVWTGPTWTAWVGPTPDATMSSR